MTTNSARRDRIIVDANIVVSAVMGRSLPLVANLANRATVMIPWPQMIEMHKVLERRRRSDSVVLQSLFAIVEPLESTVFEPFEAAARQRLHDRGQSDWPVLAAALALDADIWSGDRDFFGVGVPVWETRNIIYAALDAAETEQDA